MRKRLIAGNEILAYISSYLTENGYPPTRRDLARKFATSNRKIQESIAELARRGELILVPYPRSPRTAALIQIPDAPYLFKDIK